MAELEDFFAKRDKKKKSKGKTGFESVDIDDVAKVLDAKAKERKKLEMYQPPVDSDQPVNDHGAKEDEEWKEVVDDKPDFTGLKIQEFSLADEDHGSGKDGEGHQDRDSVREGPWKTKKSKPVEVVKKIVQPPPPVLAPAPVPVETKTESLEPKSLGSIEDDKDQEPLKEDVSEEGEPTKIDDASSATGVVEPVKYLTPAQKQRAKEEAAKPKEQPLKPMEVKPRPPISSGAVSSGALGGSGKYVPIHLRAGSTSTPSSTGYTRPKKAMAAPNINSEEYFPSLGGNQS